MSDFTAEYKITVEKKSSWKEMETKNFLLKKTPTDITKQRHYSSGEEVQYIEEWSGPKEVEERKTYSEEILELTVAKLDLKKLIDAALGE